MNQFCLTQATNISREAVVGACRAKLRPGNRPSDPPVSRSTFFAELARPFPPASAVARDRATADLHASEMNGEISWFCDNSWGATIGDKLNGYRAEAAELPSLGYAAPWLCDRAVELYPDSEFATEYWRTHPDYKPQTETAVAASSIGAAISTGVVPTDALAGSPQKRRNRSRRAP